MKFFKKAQLHITHDQFFYFIKNDNETIDQLSSRTQHYMQCYDHYKKGRRLSWNWSAFFFSILWYAYHRMFIECFIWLFFLIITQNWLVVCVCAGLSANSQYMFYANRQIVKGTEHHKTNWLWPIIMVCLVSGLILLAYYSGFDMNTVRFKF